MIIMPRSVSWSQDFFYNVAERALFGGHPIKTLKAYVLGERLRDVGAFARRTGLSQDENYRGMMSEREAYGCHESSAEQATGHAYFDSRRNETVVRIDVVRMSKPDGTPLAEGKTFVLPGDLLTTRKNRRHAL